MRAWERWEELPREYLRDSFMRFGKGVNAVNRRRVRQILKDENPASLLDVGCGPGVDYEGFKEAGLSFSYTGVDITPKIIDVAQEKYPEARWLIGDIYDLPFADGEFDAVLCRAVLEHLPEYESALSEMYRVASKAVIINLYRPLTLGPTNYRFEGRMPGVSAPFVSVQYNWREFLTSLWALEPQSLTVERFEDGHLCILRRAEAPLASEINASS